MYLHKASSAMSQNEFHSEHTHLRPSVHTNTAHQSWSEEILLCLTAHPQLYSIITILHVVKEVFTTSAVIHTRLKGVSTKGSLGHCLELLTNLLIKRITTSHTWLHKYYIFDRKGDMKPNWVQFRRAVEQARYHGNSVFYSSTVAIFFNSSWNSFPHFWLNTRKHNQGSQVQLNWYSLFSNKAF